MHFQGPFVIATKHDRANPEVRLIGTAEGQSGLDAFLAADLSSGVWSGSYVGSWGFYSLLHRAIE